MNSHAGASLKPEKNLSDVASAATARSNLGLGGAALLADPIPWANVSKAGSSLADLTTRSASDLSSGTLADARLSANVPLLDAATNVFAGNLTVNGNASFLGATTHIASTVVDITDRVTHVNHSTGANDPVPTFMSGFGVHRGAIGGVARDHAVFVWDESSAKFKAAWNTGGDDATFGTYLDLQAKDISGEKLESVIGGNIVFDSNALTAYDAPGVASVDWGNRQLLDAAGALTVDFNGLQLQDGGGNVVVDWSTGIANDTSTVLSLDWVNRTLNDAAGASAVNWGTGLLIDASSVNSADWLNRQLFDSSGTGILYWDAGYANDTSGVMSVDWENRLLKDSSGDTIADWSSASLSVTELTQNVQYVVHVAKNGTDTRTGLSNYSIVKPFATIQAAITAASSGDLVWVHPGTYSEQLTLKNGVNLHYDNGAISAWTPVGNNQGILTDGGAPCTCVISGKGKFELTSAAFTNQFLLKTTAASDLKIDAIWFKETGALGTEVGLYDSGGSTWVIRADIIGTAIYPNNAGSNVSIYGNVSSGRGYPVYQDDGLLKIYGDVATTAVTISAIYNVGGRTQVFGGTITGTTSAIECVGTSAVERLRLIDCELVAANNLYAIDYSTGTGSISFLKGCVFRPHGSATYCLRSDTAGTATVKLLDCYGTKPPTGGAGTFTISVNDYIEDADL